MESEEVLGYYKQSKEKSEKINLLEEKIKYLKSKIDRMKAHIPNVYKEMYEGY